MADTLSTLSIVAFALAGVFFVAAVVLFIVLKIPKVIDYFTNHSAKKAVRKMREGGSSSKTVNLQNNRKPNAGDEFLANGPDSAKDKKAGPLKRPSSAQNAAEDSRPETSLLAPEQPSDNENGATTEDLTPAFAPETEALDDLTTAVLTEPLASVAAQPSIQLTPLEEVMLIHTNEVIR